MKNLPHVLISPRSRLTAFCATFVLLFAMAAQAATFTVNSTLHGTDSNPATTTLVEAINAANTAGGSNTIELAANTTYASDDTVFIDGTSAGRTMYPAITSNITIHGNGATLDASGKNARFFYVSGSGALTLEQITLAGGKAQGGAGGDGNSNGAGGGAGMGGAIFVNGSSASLTIRRSSITGCSASGGIGGNFATVGVGGPGGGGGGMGGAGSSSGGGGGPRSAASGSSGGDTVGGNAGANDGGFGGGGGGGTSGNAGAGGFGGGGGGGYIVIVPFGRGPGGAGGFGGGGGATSGAFAAAPGGTFGGFGAVYTSGGNLRGGSGGGLGGAVFNYQGTVTLENVSITGNSAIGNEGADAFPGSTASGAGSGVGGGLFNYDGTVTMKHTTIVSNTVQTGATQAAQSTGGAVYNYDAPGGGTPSVTMFNSVCANSTYTNATGTEVVNNGSGTVTASGAASTNIITNSTGTITGTVRTTAPTYGPATRINGIQGNLPLAGSGSSVLDNGDNANSLATDLFGNARPANGTVDIGATEGTLSTSFTLTAGMLLVCDTNADAVYAVDPATGNRSIISKLNFVGTGPDIQNPLAITTDTSGNIYVVNTLPAPVSIVKIDPANGNRTTISNSAVGTGTNFISPSGIAFRASDGKLIVTDNGGTNGTAGADAVFVVDPATGNRTILSDDVTPNATNALSSANTVIVHSTLGIVVADIATSDAVIKVDAATGARTVVSSSALNVPDAVNPFTNPNAIAEDTNGTILLIEGGVSPRQLLRINPTTGARTLEATLTTDTFAGVTAGTAGVFLTKSTNPDAVFKLGAGGTLSLVTGSTKGDGVLFGAGSTSAGLNLGIAFYGSAPAAPAPTVTSVSPSSGPTTGGSVVSITGTNFTGATAVTIGGTAVTSFHVVNATTIEAVTPAKAAGSASVVVTTGGGSNAANTLFTYNAAVASTVVDFETAATGSLATNATSFTSSAKTWTLTGFLIGDGVPNLGSAPVGSATPASNGFLDTGLTTRSAGSVGAIVAPTGNTFRAVGIDIWPSSNSGNSIIPYSTGINDVPGETGHTFNVKGYRNGSVVVNVNVIDTLRTPPQSGSISGGYWHHLEFTNSAFDTTDIDKLEFFIVTQSGTAFDGPNSGSALSTPNYIALDNFVYSSLTVTASSNADLSALSFSTGTISPSFAAGTTAYSFNVPNATASTTVTATRADANATLQVQVNGGGFSALTSGSPSGSLSLNVGANTVDVKVTAQDGTTVKTYTTTITRAAGAPDHLAFGVQPSDTVAGAALTPAVTVRILDATNNLTTSTANVTLAIGTNPGGGTLSGTTTVAAVNGVATFSNLSINKTGAGYTLSASGTVTGATSSAFNITPAAAATLAVSTPANATAGLAFSATVTARDAFGNIATGYTGTVHFTKSDSGAGSAVPTDYAFTGGDSGVHTFTNGVTFATTGNQTLTATDTATSSITGTSANVAVAAGAATHFTVSAPASATAGVAFNTLTVTALDQFNNTATGYSGMVHFTSSDGAAVLPADSTLTGGTGTFSATLKTAGTRTITATDTVTSSITGTSGNVAVAAGAATQFAVSAPAQAGVNTAFSATVTAQDAFGNTAIGYTGTVHFTKSDSGAGSAVPADYAFAGGDSGVHTFTNGVTFVTAGNQTLTATDTVTSSITGSANVTVMLPPAVTASFSPTQVAANTLNTNPNTTLTYTITNPNAVALTGVGFTQTMPSGLSPNSFSSPGSPGGGTFTPGGASFTLSGITVPANGQIQFSVGVRGVTVGVYNNVTTTPVTSANGGTGNAATANTLTVLGAPTITAAFGAATFGTGEVITLTYTVVNPNTTVPLTGLAFNDVLPAGLVIAKPRTVVNNLNGTVTAVPGTDVISLTGGTIAAGTTTTLTVNITALTPGVKTGMFTVITSAEVPAQTTQATPVPSNSGISTLTFARKIVTGTVDATDPTQTGRMNRFAVVSTISSPKAFPGTFTTTGARHYDTYTIANTTGTPQGVDLWFNNTGGTVAFVAAYLDSFNPTSLGTNYLADPGSSWLGTGSFGFTIPAGHSAVIVVHEVNTGTPAFNYILGVNTPIPPDAAGVAALPSVNVIAKPFLVQDFVGPYIPVNTATPLTFTLINPGPSAFTNVSFTETLPAGLTLATPNGFAGSVGGGTLTATAGSSSISLSGATVPANSQVQFTLNVTASTLGTKTFTSSPVTSTETGSGGFSYATVEVVAPPTFSMAFNPAQIPIGGTSSLDFTIVNPAGNAIPLTGVGFTLTLPAGLTVASATSAVGGGALTTTAPTDIALSGATVGVGGTLQFSVTVTAPGSGSFTATTGPITSAEGGNGLSAVATLTTNRPPDAGPVFAARGPATSVKIPIAQIIAAAPDPDAGDIVTLVSVGNPVAPAHGTAVISGSNVIYTPAPGNTTGVTFSYTVTDNHGAQATGTVTVTVNGTPGATSVQITKMTRAADGTVSLTFAGVPGYTYGLQFTDDLMNPWVDLGPVPMNAVGQATFTDSAHNASPNAFYRFIYPAP